MNDQASREMTVDELIKHSVELDKEIEQTICDDGLSPSDKDAEIRQKEVIISGHLFPLSIHDRHTYVMRVVNIIYNRYRDTGYISKESRGILERMWDRMDALTNLKTSLTEVEGDQI